MFIVKFLLKHTIRIVLALIVLLVVFALYFVGGTIIAYKAQPEVSPEYRAAFHAEDCCSDVVSCDRAYVVEDNEEALIERLRMIEQARDRIILSTFEFRADESGKDILAALLAAARRGVRIQIVADGMASCLRMDRNAYFYALASMDTVEIKIYNKLNPLMPWKSMGRLHDKYIIVDDSLYLLGGRNTYDYFLGDNGYKNYDRDVLVYTTDPAREDSSIHQLEAYFESVWSYEECRPFKAKNSEQTQAALTELAERYQEIRTRYPAVTEKADYTEKTFEVNKITLLSNPIHVHSKEPTLFYSLVEIMKSYGGDISIHTPYIICNEWMYDSLREVCDGSPNTRLLTNSAANNGNPFGASDYLKNKGRLLETGLTIYEYEGGVSYHGKSIAIGDRLSVIGSFNMDMRSVYLDTELMLVIDSEALNRQLREKMQVYEKDCVKALDAENYEIPDNVERQELSAKRKQRIDILRFFNWLRFLM